jgi:hypothetical protein
MPRSSISLSDEILRQPVHALKQANLVQFTPALENTAPVAAVVQQTNDVPQLRLSTNAVLNHIDFIDPQLAGQLGQVGRPLIAGVTRDQISVPICPTVEVTDQVLFEAAATPAQKFYLPRYRIATQVVSGHQQYRLTFEEYQAGWQLVAYLERFPAPELGSTSQAASELPHDIAVILRYQIVGSGGAQKELAFNEVTQADGGMRAALTVASLVECDELFRAMTIADYHAELIVRRVVRVAVPVNPQPLATTLGFEEVVSPIFTHIPITLPPPPPVSPILVHQSFPLPIPFPPPRPMPTPNLIFKGNEVYEAGGQSWVRYSLSVSNWDEYATDLFAPAPDLPPCGNNTNASRTWVDIYAEGGQRIYGFCGLGDPSHLDGIWFAVAVAQQAPPSVYITLNDRRTGQSISSAPLALPVIPRFREVSTALDSMISPFLFSPDLHGYIFRNITPQTSPATGLLRWQVAAHSYYQELARPYIFYYLPDAFKLVRRPDGTRPPWMSVRLTTSDGFHSQATTQVTLSYAVAPFLDADRLAAATPELASHIPASAGRGPQLEPLMTTAVRFFIERPQAVGAVTEERNTASVALRSAIHDTLTMPLTDFQPLFDALVQPNATLFHGKVVVDVSGWPAEEISFIGRMDDLAGDVLFYAAIPDGASGGLKVTLTNAIESKLRIGGLTAALSRGGAFAVAEIHDLSLPIEKLEPGESMTFVVAPHDPVSGDGELVARFDLDDVKTIPDALAIWNAIVEEATSDYYRNITVKAVPALFEPPADRPDDQIVAIVVAFERGATVELAPDHLEDTAQVDLPIEAVIARQTVSDAYNYRVTTVRKNGQQQDSTPAPRRDQLFYVDVVK